MPFPSDNQFTPVLLGNSPYFDNAGDQFPPSTDLVGNATFPVAFYAYDGTNIYLRIRVNGDPRNLQKTGLQAFAWGLLINTSGQAGTYDWLLAAEGIRQQFMLIQNTIKEVNSWNDPAEGTDGRGNPNFRQPIINFDIVNTHLTNDGSNFSGNPDYFIDMIISASNFFSFLSITETSPLRFVTFTSAGMNNADKDSLRVNENFSFANALSDPAAIQSGDVRAKLAITKERTSGPSSVMTGQQSQWTGVITVRNTGKSAATTVFVNDLIELDQVNRVAINSTSLGSASYNPDTKVLSWNVGNLAPGQSATLSFTANGLFNSSNGGTRTLDTTTVTGVDGFTGGQLSPAQAAMTINVQTTGGAAGRVLDQSTGLSVAGATVELHNTGGQLIASTTTDSSGSFSLTGIATGTYNLVVSAPAYTTNTQAITIISNTITNVTVLLAPVPGTVTGTVTSSSSTAIPDAQVRIINTFGVVVDQTITNASGGYQFTNVAPGNYTISVSANGFQSQTGAVNVERAQTATLNFVLPPTPGTINGTVTDSNGVPIQGALVEVLDDNGILIVSAATNASGQYTINSLAPGMYQLRVKETNFSTENLGFSINAGETKTINASLQPSPGTLTGVVTDNETGQPIPNASIRVVENQGTTVATAQTNSSGVYTIPSLAPGNYSVTIGADGYANKTLGASIQPGETTTLNAALEKLAGVLAGTISTVNGDPISGAVVNVLFNNVVIATAGTAIDGSYTITGLSPNSYSVIVSADGFQTQVIGATIQARDTTDASVQLQASPGNLTGTVRDKGGQPISGATVTVRQNSASGPVVKSTITDTSGNYTVTDLRPDQYAVTASAPSFEFAIGAATIAPNQTTTLNFLLQAVPRTITGTVTDAQTGNPIAGSSIEVRIIDANGAIIATTFSDLNGNYTISRLSAGTYTVFARAENYQTNAASVSLGPNETTVLNIALTASPGQMIGQVFDASTSQSIVGATVTVIDRNGTLVASAITDSNGSYLIGGLAPGNYVVNASAPGFQNGQVGAIVLANTATTINIGLAAQHGRITGTVSPAAAEVIVQLYDANNVFIASVVADASGNFAFSGLAPGNYTLVASAPSFSSQAVGASVAANETTATSITLTPDPATISGRITSTEGQPLTNAVVKVLDSNETVLGIGFTDADGNYSVGNLPPGSLVVTISANGFGNAVGGVTLSPGEEKTGVNFQLQPNPGSISGQITNAATGEVIASANVLVRSATDGTVATTAASSPFGNFLIEDISPGSYNVVVSAEGFGTSSTGVNVERDQTASASLALSPLTGNIAGQIQDEAGNPITGNNIQVKLFDRNQVLLQTVLANSDGSFTFFNLPPGNYTINATADRFASSSIGVNVQANETSTATVTLTALSAALVVRVVNAVTSVGIAGSTVKVTNSSEVILGMGITDGEGFSTIENQPAGNVTISASAESFGTDSVGAILRPGETTDVTLRLTPNPGSLSGRVTNLDTGEPIPGASVNVFDSTQALVSAVLTDTQGNYLVTGLTPGRYTAVAAADGFTTDIGAASIESNTETVLSFALDPQPATITGTVRDESTGQPLAGATVLVRLGSTTGPIISTVLTDDQGRYTASGLAPDSYTLIATFPPVYGSEASSTIVGPGQTQTLNFTLPLQPARVTGQVTDASSGALLSNTLVRLLDTNGAAVTFTQTDNNGNYLIEGFPAGMYTLVFINETFQRQAISFTAGQGATVTVNAALAPNPGRLTGTVTDAQSGTPLVGAIVEVYAPQSSTLVARAITDGSGVYAVEGLAPGTYTVVATQANYAAQSAGATIVSNQTATTDISLVPNPASVSGTVTDTAGTPIANATVQIMDQSGAIFGSGVTDDNGHYAIGNLPAGSFVVKVSATGFSTEIGGVELEPGEQVTGLTFRLPANPGNVTGQITNAGTGEPLVGANVAVRFFANGVLAASTVTDVNGVYFISGLAPGSYTVIASASRFGTNSVGVHVVSDQTAVVPIALSPLVGQITGGVRDTAGNLISGNNIQVSLYDVNQVLVQSILANSDGTFTFVNVAPGTYTVTATAPGFATNSVGASVQADQTTTVSITLISLPATITGQVRNAATGEGIAGSTVTVTDNTGTILASSVTDSLGSFTINHLPAGSAVVIAFAPGFGSSSTGVILTAGETSNVILSLAPNPGRLLGRITNVATGAAIPGATVRVFDNTQALIATVLSDPQGNYTVPALARGRYTAVASAEGFTTELGAATIQSNTDTILNFALMAQPATIRGMVRGDSTGQPLAGATVLVRLGDTTGPIVATVLTDNQGQYTASGLAPDSYTLTATFPPVYGSEASSTIVGPGETRTLDFTLPLQPARVTGQVTDAATEAPLANTLVRLLDANGAAITFTQTDGNGNYLIEGFPGGTYTLVFINDRFQRQAISFTAGPGETAVVNAALAPNPGRLTGIVRDARRGTPLVGAVVQVFLQQSSTLVARAVTDGSGLYVIEGLATGTYTVTAMDVNYATQSVGVTILSNETTTTDISLVPNPASVSGTVTDTAGTPIANATVQIMDQSGAIFGSGVTDDNGNYAIGNLPAGTFVVKVSATGFSTEIGGVELEPGERVTGLTFRLPANPGNVTGQITSVDTGEPLTGGNVIVRIFSNGVLVASTVTNSKGNYLITGLAPGFYTVEASANGFATNTTEVNVFSGQTTTANLALRAQVGQITGSVRDSDGNPITGINIQVKLFDANQVLVQSILANSDGTFTFLNVAPGTYTVTATAPGFATNSVGVTVEDGKTANITITLASLPAVLTGQVVNEATGAGIAGSSITVFNNAGVTLATGITDGQGFFTIGNLPAGSVIVTAAAQGFGTNSIGAILTAGETTNTVLRLTPNPGRLTGRVTRADTGQPIAGAAINIFDSTQALVATVLTDSQGNYTVATLAPGRYRVVASANGFANGIGGASIESDTETVLNFALANQPAIIQGTVRDESTNQPLAGAAVQVRQESPTGPVITTVVTNDQGQYVVTGLTPTSYTLIASLPPRYGTKASSVVVGPDETITLDFSLPLQPARVSGRITSAQTGEPILNTLIRLLDVNGVIVASTQTDVNGNYLIEGFPSGTYTLVIRNESFQRQSISFTVGARETATVDASLNPNPGTLQGIVRYAQTGEPLAGAVVEVFAIQSTIPLGRSVSDETGMYLVEGLAPGTYTVTASTPNFATQSVGATILPNETTQADITLVPNPATISGVITDTAGTPIANASVQLLDENGTVLGSAVTDDNGNYAIGNLPEGTFVIKVSAAGFAILITGIILAPGEQVTGLTFSLTPDPGNITGRITDSATGLPIIGAEVRVVLDGILLASTVTDENGGYVLAGLAPGSYTVVADANGYGTKAVGVIVESGQTSSADLAISPLVGRIEGSLLDTDGNPITGNNIQVKLYDNNQVLLQSIVANADGTFAFVDVAPGTYTITATAPGFATNSVGASVQANVTTTISITLASLTATLTGRTVNSVTGEGIPGSIITVTNAANIILATTVSDSQGAFAIFNLPAGAVTISARAPNFGGSSLNIVLQAEETANITIPLTASAGTLTGRIASANIGNPIEGATVQVFDSNGVLVASVLTDANGIYAVENLSAGSYSVVVSAAGFVSATATVTVMAGTAIVLNFSLEEEAVTSILRGRVTDARTGNPIPGALIEVRVNPVVATAITDENGNFLIAALPPGDYEVRVKAAGFQSQTIRITIGQNEVVIENFALAPSIVVPGRLRGTVFNKKKQPIQGVMVLIFTSRSLIRVVKTDSRGVYEVVLPPGKYKVHFLKSGFVEQTLQISIASGMETILDITLVKRSKKSKRTKESKQSPKPPKPPKPHKKHKPPKPPKPPKPHKKHKPPKPPKLRKPHKKKR